MIITVSVFCCYVRILRFVKALFTFYWSFTDYLWFKYSVFISVILAEIVDWRINYIKSCWRVVRRLSRRILQTSLQVHYNLFF